MLVLPSGSRLFVSNSDLSSGIPLRGLDVVIFRLNERRFVSHCNFTTCFPNFERDIHCAWRSEQDIHGSALFSKACMRYCQRVARGSKKGVKTDSFVISFR